MQSNILHKGHWNIEFEIVAQSTVDRWLNCYVQYQNKCMPPLGLDGSHSPIVATKKKRQGQRKGIPARIYLFSKIHIYSCVINNIGCHVLYCSILFWKLNDCQHLVCIHRDKGGKLTPNIIHACVENVLVMKNKHVPDRWNICARRYIWELSRNFELETTLGYHFNAVGYWS